MEGLELKNWRLGEKIGAGACSDVYAVEPLKALSAADKGARFVMKVSRIPDITASKAKNKKRKKTPAERNADALYAEYLIYQSCLRDHARVPRLPDGAYGEDKGYRFLVLERLGRTLERVLQDEGPIPSATAARLGLEILDTIQHMHVNNVVYVDIKPENFMVDADDETNVYCVDFGISDRYVMATGKHKEHKVGSVVGTPTFLSANCHAGATPSRRDDIEALLYVLIYLQLGSLPWQSATSDTSGAKLKKATAPAQLCSSLPLEWTRMLETIRACGFGDKPDYAFFATQFSQLGGQLGLNKPFDWGGKAVKQPAVGASKSKGVGSKQESDAEAQTSAASKGKRSATARSKSPVPTRAAAPNARTKSQGATRSAKKQKHRADDDAASASTGESDDDSDDEPKVVKTVAPDPRRRRKAAIRAVGAEAAATAAAKLAERASTRVLRSSRTSL